MNPDDLEQRLARIPRGGIPREWREEILATAKAAVVAASSPSAEATPVPESTRSQAPRVGEAPRAGTGVDATADTWIVMLARMLRRSPWSLLAAGWLFVVALNHVGSWIESGPAVPGPALASAGQGSGPAALAAARSYRAEVAAWTRDVDAGDDPDPVRAQAPRTGPARPVRREMENRPQGFWRPGRGDSEFLGWT